jgi:hypothetical protein
MTGRRRLPGGRLAIAVITISAITGTLFSCGRYGRPVRVAPAAETIAEPVEEEAGSGDTKAEDESSDRSDRSDS